MRYFVYFVIAVVAAAIVAGFMIVPSPAEERLLQADNQRINDLGNIQSEVLNYWINKGVLPKALTDLRDDLRGIVIPTDPQSSEPYIYEVKSATTFALCATFVKPNMMGSMTDRGGMTKPVPVSAPGGYYNGLSQNWQHDEGYVCFDRTIDPDFYKPLKAPTK